MFGINSSSFSFCIVQKLLLLLLMIRNKVFFGRHIDMVLLAFLTLLFVVFVFVSQFSSSSVVHFQSQHLVVLLFVVYSKSFFHSAIFAFNAHTCNEHKKKEKSWNDKIFSSLKRLHIAQVMAKFGIDHEDASQRAQHSPAFDPDENGILFRN